MLQNFKTYHLAVELHEKCKASVIKGAARSQLDRASLSVALNIAEGSAKTSIADRKRFYEMALASCRETQAILHINKQHDLFKLADAVGGCLYRLVHR
ncbi:MAG TPA: four helix bundle protein [Bdellovibrionales bacterium]|nr:four helix bundle protein [Bdellovibrionales bacterium]